MTEHFEGNPMNEQITVMLVDDQQLVRGGLKMLINSQPDLQVVLEADDGAAAVDSYARMAEEGTAPQVVLMDVRMPIMDGLEAAKSILELNVPDSRVIMLTTFDVDEYVYANDLDDFFAKRPTAYTKHDKPITANDLF